MPSLALLVQLVEHPRSPDSRLRHQHGKLWVQILQSAFPEKGEIYNRPVLEIGVDYGD